MANGACMRVRLTHWLGICSPEITLRCKRIQPTKTPVAEIDVRLRSVNKVGPIVLTKLHLIGIPRLSQEEPETFSNL